MFVYYYTKLFETFYRKYVPTVEREIFSAIFGHSHATFKTGRRKRQFLKGDIQLNKVWNKLSAWFCRLRGSFRIVIDGEP